jgi:hypothetical protein
MCAGNDGGVCDWEREKFLSKKNNDDPRGE